MITSERLPGEVYTNILPDTGANFDAININIVRKHDIHVHQPTRAAKCLIAGAFNGMSTPRIGYVHLRITVHFPLQHHRNAISFTKRFEVTEMSNDFILATGTMKVLFPHDESLQYVGPSSIITDAPHHIHEHTMNARTAAWFCQGRYIHASAATE